MNFVRSQINKVRAERQNRSAYASLIDDPTEAEITLPANGTFAFQATAAHSAGATVCTVAGPTNRAIACPAMEDGDFFRLDRLERGSVVTVSAGFDMLLHMGLGVYVKIAEGA